MAFFSPSERTPPTRLPGALVVFFLLVSLPNTKEHSSLKLPGALLAVFFFFFFFFFLLVTLECGCCKTLATGALLSVFFLLSMAVEELVALLLPIMMPAEAGAVVAEELVVFLVAKVELEELVVF